jgi:hypothetical protein
MAEPSLYQRFIGGLLGEDLSKLDEEQRKRLTSQATSRAVQGLLMGEGLLGGLGGYRRERQAEALRQQQRARQLAQESQMNQVLRAGGQMTQAVLEGRRPMTAAETMPDASGLALMRGPRDLSRLAGTLEGQQALLANPELREAVLGMAPQRTATEKLYTTPNIKDFTRESFQYYLATQDPRYLISLDEAGTPEARQKALLDRERFRQETGIVLPDLFAGQGGATAGGGGPSVSALPSADGAMADLSPTQRREFYAKQLETETEVVDEALASARKAIPQLREVQNSLKILYEGKPITGLGAEYSKNFARLGSLVSGRPSQEVQDTELLEALLGRDVFSYIQSLGIGARGLDTPNERVFLQGVMSGEIGMSQDTLIRMTEMREKYLREGLEAVNERINSGGLDWYYNIKGRFGTKKQPFEIPTYSRPQAITEGREARDDATGRTIVFRDGNWRDPITNEIVR